MTNITNDDVLLDLYKIHAYIPNDAQGNPLTPFGNFSEGYKVGKEQAELTLKRNSGEPVFWNIGNLDGTINNLGAVYRSKENAQFHIDEYKGELHALPIPLYTAPPTTNEVKQYVERIKGLPTYTLETSKDWVDTVVVLSDVLEALSTKPVELKG